MLKVDLITRSYGAELNGLSRYDRALYSGLIKRGDVTIRLNPISASQPLLARWLQGTTGLDAATFFSIYPLSIPKVTGDIIHLTTSSHSTALNRRQDRPVVVTVHDIIHYTFRRNRRLSTYRHLIQQYCDVFSLRQLRLATAIIASSEFTKQQLIQHIGILPEQVTVVPLGIDLQQFRPKIIPLSFLDQYGLRAETPYVLHVSSEEPRKNIPTLLQAWRIIYKHHPDAVLLKVGRCLYPSERRILEEMILEFGLNKSVRFIDAVPDDDLVMFYNLARVFTLPSLVEGFGFPVLEAMACGTPVVCSNTGSLPELVGDAALMVDPTNSRALAEAIGNLLDNTALVNQLRTSGLIRASSFRWEGTVSNTVELYKTLAASLSRDSGRNQ